MTASPRAVMLAQAAAQAAADKLGSDLVILDVSEQLVITDCFVIVSGGNERQVAAIVNEVTWRLRDLDVRPSRREGEREARWVLLDFVDIVVHVQHTEERVYYSLERLWRDCPTVPFVDRDLEAHRAGQDTGSDEPAPAEDLDALSADSLDFPAGNDAEQLEDLDPDQLPRDPADLSAAERVGDVAELDDESRLAELVDEPAAELDDEARLAELVDEPAAELDDEARLAELVDEPAAT